MHNQLAQITNNGMPVRYDTSPQRFMDDVLINRISIFLWLIQILIPILLLVLFLFRKRFSKRSLWILIILHVLLFAVSFYFEYALFGEVNINRFIHPVIIPTYL